MSGSLEVQPEGRWSLTKTREAAMRAARGGLRAVSGFQRSQGDMYVCCPHPDLFSRPAQVKLWHGFDSNTKPGVFDKPRGTAQRATPRMRPGAEQTERM